MYKHILIATDGSECSAKAISQGVALAKACGSDVTIGTVTDPLNSLGDRQHMFEGLPDDMRKQAIDFLFDDAKQALSKAEAVARADGVQCQSVTLENANAYEALISAAEQNNCDLIVMASHGRRGMSRLLLGSETMRVLTHTTIPVLVCR